MRRAWKAAVLALAGAASAAGQAYVAEIREGRVVSAVDETSARGAAAWLERVRELYREWGFEPVEPNRPTVAVLLPTVFDLAPFLRDETRLGRSRGLSLIGRDRNYILLAWGPNHEGWIPLAHEYAHLCDPRRGGAAWFREGLAEALSRRAAAAESAGRETYPPAALSVLRLGDWIPFAEFTRALRSSPAFEHSGFYAQSWLAVEWLASRGQELSRLEPEHMDRAAFELGPAGVEEALRAFEENIAGRRRGVFQPRASAAPVARAAEAWTPALTLAEVLREIGRHDEAAARLAGLESTHPEEPAIQAALGALAMDRGRYDEAERRLRRAADDPAAENRTLHRLALMLLRPVEGEAEQPRAEEAAAWMRRVVARVPGEPSYRLTLAHALMVAERWEAASEELRRLAADREWRARAEEEHAELLRRKQQRLAALPAPAIAPSSTAANSAPVNQDFPTISQPPEPEPPPAAPSRSASAAWPPAGAHVLAGKIVDVDCSGTEKLIIMEHPLFSMKFREPRDRPAKLYFPPLKWKKIPCGASGWRVNLAYRPLRNVAGVRGVALAILF